MSPQERLSYVPAARLRALTRLYDPLLRLLFPERRLKQALIDQIVLEPGVRVLDLGCGTGTLLLFARQRVPAAALFGVDIDEDVLAIARGKACKARLELPLVRASATALPFPAACFDRVVSTLVFHHLSAEQKRAALAESARILRPGAPLYVLDFGAPSGPVMRALFFVAQVFEGFSTTRDNVAGRLPSFMVQAGFETVEVLGTYRTIFGSVTLFRARAPGPRTSPSCSARASSEPARCPSHVR